MRAIFWKPGGGTVVYTSPWDWKYTTELSHREEGGTPDIVGVIRTLVDLRDEGVKSIVWSGGGEPTTHPDWLHIIEYAAWLGFEQGMYTLGGLLSDETAARLAKC